MNLMKKVNPALLLITLLMASAPLMAQWGGVRGSGKVVTQDRETPSFSAVEVECSADVYLRQGDQEAIKVRADENLLDMIETEVRNDVLHIDIDGNIRNYDELKVYVTVKNLNGITINGSGDVESENKLSGMDFEIRVNGSGDVDLDLDVKNLTTRINGSGDVEFSGVQGALNLNINGSGDVDAGDLRLTDCEISVRGSGDIRLSGSADKVYIDQSASGDINLYGLESGDVEVSASGSGDVVVSLSGKLKARLHGSGDLTYKGSPTSVDVSATGSGEVYSR